MAEATVAPAVTAATGMPAAPISLGISFSRRFMSEHSRVLVDQLFHVLLEANDDLLPDIDVEVDLDRLVRRAHLNAAGAGESHRCGQEEFRPPHRTPRRIGGQSRPYGASHRIVSLSWG